MSSDQPPSHQPEYLDTAAAPAVRRRSRRIPVLGAALAGVVGVLALGSWAAVSFMGGGTTPAEAVPGNAVAFVSLDLDPTASQKVEAVRILDKFPQIRERLDIDGRDDLRRWLFEQVTAEHPCPGVDYDEDVAPWIGDRVAVAAVPARGKGTSPTPVLALQVTDRDAATTGIEKLAACGGAGDVGVAMSGDYALLSDTKAHADSIAAAVEERSLAEDADYRRWTDRLGDRGIVSLYVAPGAMAYAAELQDSLAGDPHLDGAPGGDADRMLPSAPDMAAMRRQVESMSEDFRGMAGVVRFDDGVIEAEVVGDVTGRQLAGGGGAAGVTDLPDSTAVALGVTLADGWARQALDSLGELSGSEEAWQQMLATAEAMTGLRLPEDLERLLGDGFALALDADADPAGASDPTTFPAGIRVVGDGDDVEDVVDRVRAALGPRSGLLVSERGDDAVALGLDAAYVRELAGDGGLGDRTVFTEVVPDAEAAAGVVFVDLDAVERWVDDQELRADIAPLRALGVSSSVDDDGAERALLRLSTD